VGRPVGRERGEYVTENRAETLRRELAATEARMQAQVDRLAAELADLREHQTEQLRAQVKALLGVLQATGGS
jgi:hypothetical protein